MLPQENLTFQPLSLVLVASEHSDSIIHPLVPLYFKSNVAKMWDVSPIARSAKLQLIYGLEISKTATLDTFTFKSFTYACMTCMDGGYSQGGGGRGGGAASFQGVKIYSLAQ